MWKFYLSKSKNIENNDNKEDEESKIENSNILNKSYRVFEDDEYYFFNFTKSILDNSEISFYIGKLNEETKEKCYYGKIIFEEDGLMYCKFKKKFDKGKNQIFGINEFLNNLFSNYVKFNYCKLY